MTFSTQKPDGGPSPKDDVVQIQTNFSVFNTVFSNNHTPMNNNNQGDHEFVIFEQQAADPGVTQNLSAIFSKSAISKASTEPQLFSQILKFLPNQLDQTEAPNFGVRLTYNKVNTAGPVFQSFLHGGFLIYFGLDTGVTVSNVLISDTIILSPAPTKIVMAMAISNTMTTPGVPIPFDYSTEINTTTNDRFIIHSTANKGGPPIAYSFSWYAIGVA